MGALRVAVFGLFLVVASADLLARPSANDVPRALAAFDASHSSTPSPSPERTWVSIAAAIAGAASLVALVGFAVSSLGTSDDVGDGSRAAQQGLCSRCLAALLGRSGGQKAEGEGGVALVDAGYDSDDDAAFAAQCANFDPKQVGAAYTSAGMMTRGDNVGDDQL